MKYVLYSHSGGANHGCEALVRTIASLLAPEKVIVLSDAPEEDAYYGLNSICDSLPGKVNARKLDWINAYFRLKVKHDYYYMDAVPYFPPLDIINKEDVAISIGGDVYCYDHYPKYIAIDKKVRRRAGKTVLLGCSVEPESLCDPELREDMEQFDLIFARESITYEALKKINKNVVLVPDTAFSLKTVELPLPVQWNKEGMVGVNISPLVLKKSTNAHQILDAYSALMDYILTTTPLGVALIPHVVWSDNDDRGPLKELYYKFKQSGRITLIDDHNCCEQKGFISRCSYFVGARTHATIAAYSTCVPTLVVGYSVKSKGIARDLFGSEENYVISYQDLSAENLINKFQWICDNGASIRQALQEKIVVYANEILQIKRRIMEI